MFLSVLVGLSGELALAQQQPDDGLKTPGGRPSDQVRLYDQLEHQMLRFDGQRADRADHLLRCREPQALDISEVVPYYFRMETSASTTRDPSFTAVMRLFRAHARLEERFANGLGSIHGLSLKDTLLLMHVAHAEGGRLSRIELAKRLSVSPSTVTRTTQPLEKRGLLGRESNERDARYAYVVLTKAGRRAVGEAEASLARLSAEVFRDRWSAAEIKSLAVSLGWLTADLPGELA